MPANRRVQRVLLYRLGSLGDMVVSLPAFHLIERAFPDAERRLLTSFPPNAKAPPASAILENTGFVQGYFRYTYATRNLGELLRLWWQLIRWRPDVLVYFSGTSGTAAAVRNQTFFRLCGIRRFVGVPLTKDMQECRTLPEAPPTVRGNGPMFEHESERLVRNLVQIGTADLDSPASWDMRLTLAERARGGEALAPIAPYPFLAVSLGTKNQSNHWGVENWSALLERVAAIAPQFALVLLGAAVEKQECEGLAAMWRRQGAGPALNLCGELKPRESAAALQKATLYLGHDSGPAHLAAAVQVPCIAVFGARNPAGIWFPYGKEHRVLYHHVHCEGCLLQTCIAEGKKCILSISVEEVLEQVRLALAQKEHRPAPAKLSPHPLPPAESVRSAFVATQTAGGDACG